MSLGVTTAIRKIATLQKRIRVIQGGQGASKTFSILLILINHACNVERREILIVGAELTKMRISVINDFIKIMRALGIYNENDFKAETLYKFPNGSFIKFLGADKDSIGKGLRPNVIYFNEANNLTFDTFREMASRAAVVYVDFNPEQEFFIHDEIKERDDCDLLVLTFRDNEYLPAYERKEILSYRARGYNADGTIKNNYWANKWLVHGEGKVAQLSGLVYSHFSTYTDLPTDIKLARYLGIDWGGNDPTVLIEVHLSKKNKRLYVRQLVYTPQILNSKLIEIIKENNDQRSFVIYDSSRKDKGFELNMHKIIALGATKGAGSKMDMIDMMQEYHIHAHADSLDVQKELNSYAWKIDKKTGKSTNEPMDGNDHAMDALGYVVRYVEKFTV